MNNTENESAATSAFENNDQLQPQSTVVNVDNPMEVAILKKIEKLATLIKLNFFITFLGLGTLGYLHFSEKISIDESLTKSKVALKNEIRKNLASKEDLQSLNSDFTTKVDGIGARVSGLEVQGEQYQEEFQKFAVLNARVNEFQASMKKNKSKTKSSTKSTKKSKK